MPPRTLNPIPSRLSWLLQVAVAVILGQTLFFKLTGAPESVYIFETLGVEPWGRIGSGVVELIAIALILTPRTAGLGALLTLGVMSGALGAHLTRLGIEVQGDGGLLFVLALVTFTSAATVAFLRHSELLPEKTHGVTPRSRTTSSEVL